jgi:hypothetical protein
MALHRVPPILQSVSQARNWVVQNVPGTNSMLGYDLFLKLGNDVVAGQPLQLDVFTQGLPYPSEEVGQQLRQFEQAGLVTLAADEHAAPALRPTERFLGLLNQYSRMFESLFIVRHELRSQQLLVQTDNAELGELVRVLYDRMYDLGWLYLHNFGSACFMMASLVCRLAELHGHSARVASCYVEIQGRDVRYMLGAEGYAKAGQIDGHAVCIIDESVVVDFGLGNVRKGYRRDFHWGIVSDYRRDGAVLARLEAPGETTTWKDDWQSPGSEAELARYAPHIDALAADYVARAR